MLGQHNDITRLLHNQDNIAQLMTGLTLGDQPIHSSIIQLVLIINYIGNCTTTQIFIIRATIDHTWLQAAQISHIMYAYALIRI